MYKFRQRYALPAPSTQQLVRNCHRFDAAVEGSDEFRHRTAGLSRTRGNRGNSCEHILDTVVEFRDERRLVILELPAFRNVDINSDDATWLGFTVVVDGSAGIDPSNLTAGADDSIIERVAGAPIVKGLSTQFVKPRKIIWIHS